MAKRAEKEEKGKAGRVTLPNLPHHQAGRESAEVQKAQVWGYEQSSLLLAGVALSWEGLQVPAASLTPTSRAGGCGFPPCLLTAAREEELPVEAKGQNEQLARVRASAGLLCPGKGGPLCPGAGSGAGAGALPVSRLEPAPAGGMEGESCLSS